MESAEILLIKILTLISTYKDRFSRAYSMITSAQMFMGTVTLLMHRWPTCFNLITLLQSIGMLKLFRKRLLCFTSISQESIYPTNSIPRNGWTILPKVFLHTATHQPETASRMQNFNPNRQSLTELQATEEKILGKHHPSCHKAMPSAGLWYMNRIHGSVVCSKGFTSTRLGLLHYLEHAILKP